MKTTRIAVYAAAVIALFFALATICGCGGGGGKGNRISHGISSPYYGTLAGVATEPLDNEIGIETSRLDSWIHVFWPDEDFPPPHSFSVMVEKEETPDHWGGIHTTYSKADSDPTGGSWWFQPESNFSPSTWYRITITVTGENPVVHYFQTAGNLNRSSTLSTGKAYRPAGKADAVGETSAKHTITR